MIDGLQPYCCECHNKYRSAHPVQVKATMDKWKKNNRARIMVLSSRRRARQRGLPHSITETDIYVPDNCPISGCRRLLEYQTGSLSKASPSLDMWDPEIGYIPGNVWVICHGCNSLKLNLTGEGHIAFGIQLIDAFKEECERVAKLSSEG